MRKSPETLDHTGTSESSAGWPAVHRAKPMHGDLANRSRAKRDEADRIIVRSLALPNWTLSSKSQGSPLPDQVKSRGSTRP